MRYFSEELIANSRPHAAWWGELSMAREHFHRTEEGHASLANELMGNAAAILPRDAWIEFDNITMRVMRDDGGQPFMGDLMALAKPTNIGKLVHMTRVSSDSANPVVRSMSGQVPVAMDKVVYDWRHATYYHAAFHSILPQIAHRTRSMSGLTRDLLGAPTPEWISGEEA